MQLQETIQRVNSTDEPPQTDRTLSVIVLTYNEAKRLRACLESVAWADEIVVVDGGSTDDTREIAREFTPHVHVSDLLGPDRPGGFSDQRNFGVDKATGDWIFFLDADERATPGLAEEIRRRLLEGTDEGHTAYRMRRREHFFGVYSPHTHGLSWMDRIVRRGEGRYNGRLVHEGLVYTGTLGELQGEMLHFSKDTVAHYVSTMNRYTSLEAEEAAKTGAPLARSPWRGMIHAFCYRYFHMGSYREGTFGLLMSLMFAFYSYLCWTKHWEICKDAGQIPGETRPGALTAATAGVLRRLWHGFGRLKRGGRGVGASRA